MKWRVVRCQASRRRGSHRAAFTLIELLLVFPIIGILVSLLLPAVQAARLGLQRPALRRTGPPARVGRRRPAPQAHHQTGGSGQRNGQDAAGRLITPGTGAKTVICDLDVARGKLTPLKTLTPLTTLPSGGDTSCPGLVWHAGRLWVSYYSSHEGKTSIYLAVHRAK